MLGFASVPRQFFVGPGCVPQGHACIRCPKLDLAVGLLDIQGNPMLHVGHA